MTDRINALTVVLDHDIRIDDVQPLVEAIKQLRHVQAVDPRIAEASDHIAFARARGELSMKLWEVLHPKKGQS